MTIVKSKKFKVVMVVLFAISLFAFVNYNVWDYAKANESNDGNVYKRGVEGGEGYREMDSSGYEHGECICFSKDFGDWKNRRIKIDKDNCIKLDKGGIKGTDYKDDYVGKADHGNEYKIMDICLEVHENKLKMNYKTDTPWIDFDGAEWTLDFQCNFDDPFDSPGFVHRWQDRMDGSDSESHTFNKEELKEYFKIDSETTTLEQAIENGQCSLIIDSIYIDDYLFEG